MGLQEGLELGERDGAGLAPCGRCKDLLDALLRDIGGQSPEHCLDGVLGQEAITALVQCIEGEANHIQRIRTVLYLNKMQTTKCGWQKKNKNSGYLKDQHFVKMNFHFNFF